LASAKLILAIDQGTTNTKAVLVDRGGAIRARASRPLPVAFPRPGWVEQDPLALWNSVAEAMGDCRAQVSDAEIAAIGCSNQRESVVVWDRRTGDPIGPCVIWQCRRTAEFCEGVRRAGAEALVRERSGLPLDPLFSASKIRWLLDSTANGHARAAAGELCAGTVDSWLLWKLTGGAVHSTDTSNASRTQLLNLRECRWDTDLLAIFGVPEACLPRIGPSSGVFGTMPEGTPVASLIGDSHAALFGHAAFSPGAVKATYGTGSSLMTPVDTPVASQHGLATTVAWSRAGRTQYALEGNITNTGGAVEWLVGFLGAADAEAIAALANTVPDSAGAYLVPAFAGLGAPHWDAGARGLMSGLTRGTTAGHIARATLDAIAYQVHDVFEAMRHDAAVPASTLFADGGASRNGRLMQFQADLLGCPVVRSASADLSAIGAAWLAGLAIDFWSSIEELQGLPRLTERFEPTMDAARRTELLSGWNDALARTKSAGGAVR